MNKMISSGSDIRRCLHGDPGSYEEVVLENYIHSFLNFISRAVFEGSCATVDSRQSQHSNLSVVKIELLEPSKS